mgnify:CR=1 FL=1
MAVLAAPNTAHVPLQATQLESQDSVDLVEMAPSAAVASGYEAPNPWIVHRPVPNHPSPVIDLFVLEDLVVVGCGRLVLSPLSFTRTNYVEIGVHGVDPASGTLGALCGKLQLEVVSSLKNDDVHSASSPRLMVTNTYTMPSFRSTSNLREY